MKTIIKLGFLFLTVAFAACQENIGGKEPEGSLDDIKISGGTVVAPQWLVDEINTFANRHTYPSGAKIYPWVYSFEYDGHDFVSLHNIHSQYAFDNELYFTVSGGPVASVLNPGTGTPTDLWFDLRKARRENPTLIWSKPIPAEETTQLWGDIRTYEGWIVAPQWLVDEMYALSDGRVGPTGYRRYQDVYSLTYSGQEYILLNDALSSVYTGHRYFTLSGEWIDPGPAYPYSDLFSALDAIWQEGDILWSL